MSERAIDFRIFKNVDFPLKTFAEGDVLIAPHSNDAVMYMVKAGLLAVKVGDTVVEKVGPGEMVGELSLIDHGARSAEVYALQDSVVLAIDEAGFLKLIVKVPHFALVLMRQMAKRIRAMNAKV